MVHQPLLVSENEIDYPFMWCQNFCCIGYSFVSSQSRRVTDGWTDGRTDEQHYDPQDRAIIASSRGKRSRSAVADPRGATGHAPESSEIFIKYAFNEFSDILVILDSIIDLSNENHIYQSILHLWIGQFRIYLRIN